MSDTNTDGGTTPLGLKMGGAVLGGAGVLAVVYQYRNEAAFLAILLIGIVVVVMLLAAYKYFVEWREKKKGKVFGTGLGERAGARPTQVTASEKRVLLDDLRKKFQEGLKVFESTGKSVYRLPWYLVVGESGSGKSRMIERSGVPGPTRLKDPVEGSGGTINMNWWFRNEAVLLDTAGRLMMPEVATAESPEWDNFLDLLGTFRQHCPINGLFLVIPADTLVTDTADKLDAKARQIAQQFDRVQTALGIRFPVYVVVTKCDKVNGFRQFFEGMTQPEEQAQILGWSNPAELDEPFEPELVEGHLESVGRRLVKRRLKLLEDPIHRTDPAARRLDEVDALYLFPDNLLSLGKRLRRYLEAIFVAGEWTAMPLFLRGIYFTSALQKGGVVDKALSDALGRDVAAALGEDKQSENPFFLRDLFMEKAFKEKGLVTRASDVDKLKRGRKVVLLATGFVAALVLGGFTWYGRRALNVAIGDQARFWKAVETTKADALHVVTPDGKYNGATELADTAWQVRDVHKLAPASLTAAFEIPYIYRPVATIRGDNLKDARAQAYEALVQNTVVAPLVDATRAKMLNAQPTAWNDTATAALRQLFWLESGQDLDPVAQAKEGAPLRPLFTFALADGAKYADPAKFKEYQAEYGRYEEAFATVYKGGKVARATALGVGTGDSARAIRKGVETFLAYWDEQAGDSGNKAKAIKAVADALVEFDKAEQALLGLNLIDHTTMTTADAFLGQWRQGSDVLAATKQKLDEALRAEELKQWNRDTPLAKQYQAAVDEVQAKRQKAIADLLAAIPAAGAPDGGNALGWAQTKLTEARDAAQKARDAVASDPTFTQVSSLEGKLLARATGLTNERQHRYEIQADALRRGADTLKPPTGDTFDAKARSVDQGAAAVVNDVSALRAKPDLAQDELTRKHVCGLAEYVAKLGAKYTRTQLILGEIKGKPSTAEAWGAAVKAAATEGGSPVAVPLTGFDGRYEQEYDPAAYRAVRGSLDAVAEAGQFKATPPDNKDARVLDDAALRERYKACDASRKEYAGAYREYWLTKLPERLRVSYKSWDPMQKGLRAAKFADVVSALAGVVQRRDEALKEVPDAGSEAHLNGRALALLRDGPYLQECQTRLASWSKVSADPAAAREELLAVNWDKLRGSYLMEPSAPQLAQVTLVDTYWKSLGRAGLGAIADDVEKDAVAALASLRSLRRFPLAPAEAGKAELTVAELKKASDGIKQVRGGPPKSPESIGAASAPPWVESEVQKKVDLLRVGTENVSPADRSWIERAQRFIEAQANPRFTWTIRMKAPSDEVQQQMFGRVAFVQLVAGTDGNWLFAGTGLDQGGGSNVMTPNGANGASLFPATPVDITLVALALPPNNVPAVNNKNKFALTEKVGGPWAAAKFVDKIPNLRPAAGGPKNTWEGDLRLEKDPCKGLAIPVTITFSGEIDWPSLSR